MQAGKEKTIMNLTEQHERAIDQLLREFKHKLSQVQEQYEKSKKESEQLKMINEEKLQMQEEEHNDEVAAIEARQTNEGKQLQQVINELKNDMETLRWQKERLKNEKDQFIKKRKAEV